VNIISFLDLLSVVCLLYALTILLANKVKGQHIYTSFVFLAGIFLVNAMPNFIEWIGYESLVEPFEEFIQILLPAGYFLFFSFAIFYESERATSSRNRVLMALHTITQKVELGENPQALWEELLGRVINVMGFDGGFVHFPDSKDLVNIRLEWEGAEQLQNQIELIETQDTLLSEVLMSNTPVIIEQTSNMPDSFIQALYHCGAHSVALFPVYSENNVMGVMVIISHTHYYFSGEEVNLFSLLGHHFGEIIMNNTLLNQAMDHSQDLSRALNSRQHFLTLIADDLKDPLLRIRTMIQRLLDETASNEDNENTQILSEADVDSEKLERLIDDVREFSILDSGDVRVDFVPVDIGKELNRVADQLHNRAADKDIVIKREFSKDLPPVELDKELFRSAMRHLLSNAIKYTLTEGTVTLEAEEAGDMISIRVSDTGIGIEETDASNVFDMFYRTSIAREKESVGTGLGLTIVRRILDLHNGKITFESRKGEGTTFIITIPKMQFE